MSDIPYANIHV